MITLVGCPKPFRGDIAIIQRNAIKSWTLLQPRPEIILMGDDEGVADVCDEFQLIHIAGIKKNEYGTPLVNSVFQIGQERATFPIVCYMNCDIILMRDFFQAVKIVSRQMSSFLILGQRWDIDIKQPWNFSSGSWEEDLRALLARIGKLHAPSAMDYFVFPRGIYNDIPPFAIGRFAWDNWLVWRARTNGVPVVDVTNAVKIAHQNHNYPDTTLIKLDVNESRAGNYGIRSGKYLNLNGNIVEIGPEVQLNLALAKNEENLNIWAATWVIDSKGVLKRHPFEIALPYIYYQIKCVLPLYWPIFGKVFRWIVSVTRALLQFWKVKEP